MYREISDNVVTTKKVDLPKCIYVMLSAQWFLNHSMHTYVPLYNFKKPKSFAKNYARIVCMVMLIVLYRVCITHGRMYAFTNEPKHYYC